MKTHKIQGDISSEVAKTFKDSVAIDTEATGLLIPERDKLSLIQICSEGGDVYIVQPDRTSYKMPNLVSVLENKKIQKIGHFLRFDKSALEYFLKCKMKNIFCTKIASKICRTYTDSHGLKNLVQEFCNKKLDKNQELYKEAKKIVSKLGFENLIHLDIGKEKKFKGIVQLKQQIKKDIVKAKK